MPKNKSKGRARPPRPGAGPPFRDLTAERYYTSQKTRAYNLSRDGKFLEALAVLEALTPRYSERPDLWDLLGIIYANLGYLEPARDAFERVLQLLPPSKVDPAMRYNLAQIYRATGLIFLAYQQSALIDCFQIARQIGELQNVGECQSFKQDCLVAVEEVAEDQGHELDDFLRYGLPLEQGRLALSREEPGTAIAFFEQAAAALPDLPEAHNQLARAHLAAGNLPEALEQTMYVLEQLNTDNPAALANLVWLRQAQGDTARAQEALERISRLPWPLTTEDKVSMAQALALFDQDEAVYNIIQPLFIKPETMAGALSDTYVSGLLAAIVSAANLDNRAGAARLLDEAKTVTGNVLFDRTRFALQNEEKGPRPGGRFFYVDPHSVYLAAAARFREVLEQVLTRDFTDYRQVLKPFFDEYGEIALELLTYRIWTSDNPELVRGWLTQAVVAERRGALELVRRLAFSQTGDTAQRLAAANVLLEQGIVQADEPVQIWLGTQLHTGTVAGITARFNSKTGEPNG